MLAKLEVFLQGQTPGRGDAWLQVYRGTVGINPRQLQKCQYPAMANSCSRSSCIFWERDAMFGPAGNLGGINAWLNPTKRVAGPTDGHVGRGVCGVSLRKPLFFGIFPQCGPSPSSSLTLKHGLLLAVLAWLLCFVTMTHVAKATRCCQQQGTRRLTAGNDDQTPPLERALTPEMCHGTAIDAACQSWRHQLINPG